MGASGHRGNGVHRIGSRHRAARPNGSARGDVRRIRSRTGALTAQIRDVVRSLCMLGLGLLAGAVLQSPLRAQVPDTIPKKKDTTLTIPIPAQGDSLLRDSLARRDSIVRARIRADTIKSPLAHAPPGSELSIARRLSWSRDSLFGSGALTVADLLDRVPGASTMRSGWLASP